MPIPEPQVTPYIPQTITVHIGSPDSAGENVTVSFPEYVKNVASSEIYPTWEPAAIRANILAISSFALSRVYTEFYRSRGYPFQITSSTAYDQKFIPGRNIFENISQVVDEIFNQYIRRQGQVEPLSAKFCNGTTTTCAGLSQWGSQDLAKQGLDSMQILRRYYGDNIELVTNAPILDIQASYPGYSLQPGSIGPYVVTMQTALNRISQDYPAIPKIWPVDGVFDLNTQTAVKKFQSIFNLTPDGIVGQATWYKIVYLYTGITRLSELVSQGQRFYRVEFSQQPPQTLRPGDRGRPVAIAQFWLTMASQFNSAITPLAMDGIFGPLTEQAVRAFQQWAGLPVTGVVDFDTWDYLYRAYRGISVVLRQNPGSFPTVPQAGDNASEAYGTTTRAQQFPGYSLQVGSQDTEGGV